MNKIIFWWLIMTTLTSHAQEQMSIYMINPATARVSIDGHPIKNGDLVPYKTDSRVIFPDEESYVKGYLRLAHKVIVLSNRAAQSSGEKSVSKLSFLLKQFLPESILETPASKGAITSLADLQSYLAASNRPSQNNQFYLPEKFYIGGKIIKNIPSSVFAFDANHFLFCRLYTDTGWYDKKLGFTNQQLVIDSGIFQIDSHTVDISKIKKIVVYRYLNGVNDILNEFNPVLLPKSILAELHALQLIVNSNRPTNKEKFLYSYFNHFYGYMDESDFDQLLRFR